MIDVNEAMTKLVSVYRHDFLNVLQVVGGLAQLNKTDRLLAYIRKASEEVQQFGRLMGCGDPRLAFFIYNALLQDWPGSYVIHVTGSLPLLSEQDLEDTAAFLDVLGARMPGSEETLSLKINGPKRCLGLQILNDGGSESFWQSLAHSTAAGIVFAQEKNELIIALDKAESAREK